MKTKIENWKRVISSLLVGTVLFSGCQLFKEKPIEVHDDFASTSRIVYPKLRCEEQPTESRQAPPRTIDDPLPTNFRDLSLDDAILVALRETSVLRDLGGQVLLNPATVATSLDPAIQITDPVFGSEAALADFDAQFSGAVTLQKNDDVFNNQLIGGGANEVKQDLYAMNFQVDKFAATGTQFSFLHTTQHDNNNSPNTLFPHSWQMTTEATIRQPLLQGRGIQFNRIAGPNAQPGLRFRNGIIISRINNNVSIAEFERSVFRAVDEIVNSYWRLYFAYRNYDAASKGRDSAVETWQMVQARFKNDLPGGEADREAQAREQLFQFDQQVIAALSGTGSDIGSGLYQAESNLRRLMGLPQKSEEFLRPSDQPTDVKVFHQWQSLLKTAYQSRPEIRQQLWQIKRRQFEMVAAKNFLLPRLDALATYRANGFGDDLVGGGAGRFASSLKDFASGDHMEWEFGLQMNVPIGYRQQLAALENAKLNLRRERSVLREQEDQVAFEIGNAIRQTDHSYATMRQAYNRFFAADETYQARLAAFRADQVAADSLLEAQRRLSEAENAFHQSVVDHEIAQHSIRLSSGELLKYHGIQLSESEFRIEQ